MEGTEVSEALRDRWQITQRATYINEPTGVRISVAFYTSDAELDTLVEAVTNAGGRGGLAVGTVWMEQISRVGMHVPAV